jgi:DNA-binding MarR family transcriptional regulator
VRIDTFLQQSPMFVINRAARRFESAAAQALESDDLSFLEGLTLTAMFFEAPRPIKPSQLADAFGTTRGNISHCISSLEAKELLQRKIDPSDARAYHLVLRPQGKRCALRVIAAFDKLQQSFEKEIGKSALTDTLKAISRLESLVVR